MLSVSARPEPDRPSSRSPGPGLESVPALTVAEEAVTPAGRTLMPSAGAPEGLSDEELLGRYRELGRPGDFDELVRRYSGELHRYLVRYLRDPALADDVLQNVFLQIYAKRRLYEVGRLARPWLYAIATHQAVDALRRVGRQAAVSLDQQAEEGEPIEPGALVDLLADEAPSPLDELEEEERRRWVQDSVARLPEPLRQTLILAYYQGLKYHEIAEALGVPLGTIKSRIHIATARLRAMARKASFVENG